MADKPTLDGFHPRRPNTRTEFGGMGFNEPEPKKDQRPTRLKPSSSTPPKKNVFQVPTAESPKPNKHHGLSRSELEDSLRSIDDDESLGVADKGGRKPKKDRRRRATRKQLLKRGLIVIAVLILAVGGYVAVRFVMASSSVFKGDLFGLVHQKPLRQDANGRTNILVFGTSEDDEGGNHEGKYLTDSIMLLSVDQNTKDAYMVGIPRDLWVKYDDGGAGKINAMFSRYSNDGTNESAGSSALKAKVGEVTGLDVQYYVHINYGVVREAVDAVGGVDLTIPDYDPTAPGIYDPNFDWKCNHRCKMVNYKDGERAHMDGEHALAFARARNAAGGYGLPGGNYNREKNQQLVLIALKDKAMSAGTLTNFVAVTQLMQAMSNNLRTNFDSAEIRTLMGLGADIKPESIHSVSLNKEGELATVTGTGPDGSSIVRPINSIYDYSSIIKYIKKQLTSEPFLKEDALVVVLNGSGVPGQGKLAADKLSDMGFSVGVPANAPTSEYARRELYVRDVAKYPATLKKLESLYGPAKTTGLQAFGVSAETDFVVVVGKPD